MNVVTERRAVDRGRVVTIAALWAALTLLAVGVVVLERVDALTVPLASSVHAAPVLRGPATSRGGQASAPAPAPDAAPARWIGVTPNAIETFEPPAPTF